MFKILKVKGKKIIWGYSSIGVASQEGWGSKAFLGRRVEKTVGVGL